MDCPILLLVLLKTTETGAVVRPQNQNIFHDTNQSVTLIKPVGQPTIYPQWSIYYFGYFRVCEFQNTNYFLTKTYLILILNFYRFFSRKK